jgi:hypothetical protein
VAPKGQRNEEFTNSSRLKKRVCPAEVFLAVCLLRGKELDHGGHGGHGEKEEERGRTTKDTKDTKNDEEAEPRRRVVGGRKRWKEESDGRTRTSHYFVSFVSFVVPLLPFSLRVLRASVVILFFLSALQD